MDFKKEIEKIVMDYTDGWNQPHFIEWFSENSNRGPIECVKRLQALLKLSNQPNPADREKRGG